MLTPITLRIEDLIQRLAVARSPMSSNVMIADTLHGPGRETVRRSIERLLLSGRIAIETEPGRRRVRMVASGLMTDWGAFVTTGHAPFSLNPRGTTPTKIERPDYHPIPSVPFRFRVDPQRLVVTAPAPTCQYVGPEAEGAADTACAANSIRGFSWCLKHGQRIFPSWRDRPPSDLPHAVLKRRVIDDAD